MRLQQLMKVVLYRRESVIIFDEIQLQPLARQAIKYLVKDDIEWAPKIKDRFEPLNKTYDELFREHLANENYNINVTERTKEQRIV